MRNGLLIALVLTLVPAEVQAQGQPKAKEESKAPEKLDFTMPPRKFREGIEARLRSYHQKKEALNPKPPKVVALVLQALGGSRLNVGDRVLGEGGILLDGESFVTGAGQSVRIGYRTGDQVLVAPRTEVRFHDVEPAVDGIANPVLDLISGEVRVLVKSPKIRELKPSEGALIFVVRTAEGMMAATGTDYVVYAKPDLVSVHTLTGTVKYSRDLGALRRGGGGEVPAGTFAAITPPDRKFGVAKRFDVGAYAKALEKRLPDLRRLWVAADLEAREGKTTQRFLKAEEMRGKPRLPSAFVRPAK